jgi:hypothetical protein
MAKVLIDTIMNCIGWITTGTTTGLPLEKTGRQFITDRFQVDQSSNYITIKITTPASEEISFIALNGKELMKKSADESGTCSIQKSIIHEKSFLAGSKQLGWKRCIVIR